jgi:hypothetical protein
MTDPLLELLDGLPSATLDASRADRIRARCHAALVRRRRRLPTPPRLARNWPPIVVGVGGLYLTAVLQQVLAFYGLM